MTSVGTVTDVHRLAGNAAFSLRLSRTIAPSVGQRMCNGFQLGPHRHQPHQDDKEAQERRTDFQKELKTAALC